MGKAKRIHLLSLGQRYTVCGVRARLGSNHNADVVFANVTCEACKAERPEHFKGESK